MPLVVRTTQRVECDTKEEYEKLVADTDARASALAYDERKDDPEARVVELSWLRVIPKGCC